MTHVTLIATVAMGLEVVLNKELKQLGYTTTVRDGKVEFDGTIADICTTNLWLRTAGRVLIKLTQFKATNFDELFDTTTQFSWEDWLDTTAEFPIAKISLTKSTINSKSRSQAIIKKAIAKRLLRHAPHLPENGPRMPIHVQIQNDIVTLCLDTTGHSLSMRGYRAHMAAAPIRETLAAGLVLLSNYHPEKDVVLDPLCGTGTILIEAGLIAKNMAPGRHHQFISESWPLIPKSLWAESRQHARAQERDIPIQLFGSDQDAHSLEIARKNIELAGLDDIYVQRRDIAEVRSKHKTGKIITNPPYAHRLEDEDTVYALTQTMGRTFHTHFEDWSYYIITAQPNFETIFGEDATKNRKLFNGPIQCRYYQYWRNFTQKK